MTWLPDPRIQAPNDPKLSGLIQNIVDYLRKIQQQVNGMSGGSVSAITSANTAPPAAGNKQTYAVGDWIENKNPVVLGSSGSQYIVLGWKCITAGTPGTWVACRTLTGT